MSSTKSEEHITSINSGFFFREFTFRKNNFKDLDSKNLLEFADNVVWLDDYCFVYQIKEKMEGGNIEKWFENKVLGVAVKQIKNTLNYLEKNQEIAIENEAGHKFDIKEVKKCKTLRKIIIYEVNISHNGFIGDKFYFSTKVWIIHLFSMEDYEQVCKHLVTIAELEEYFHFRETLYQKYWDLLLNYPEQYFLAHFLTTLSIDKIDVNYLRNLERFENNIKEFDISGLIEQFSKKIFTTNGEKDYYPIIKEICKLNRADLIEFKKRLNLILDDSKKSHIVKPYRMFIPRTNCWFVFIPINQQHKSHIKNALENFTHAHKYIQKAWKCIGIAISEESNNDIGILWCYIDSKWEYDEIMEEALKTNFPFREVNTSIIENRYKNLY